MTAANHPPIDQITALQIRQAVDKFCRKRGYKISNVESLDEGDYRAFLYKKALFKKDKELIFYIRQDSRQNTEV